MMTTTPCYRATTKCLGFSVFFPFSLRENFPALGANQQPSDGIGRSIRRLESLNLDTLKRPLKVPKRDFNVDPARAREIYGRRSTLSNHKIASCWKGTLLTRLKMNSVESTRREYYSFLFFYYQFFSILLSLYIWRMHSPERERKRRRANANVFAGIIRIN